MAGPNLVSSAQYIIHLGISTIPTIPAMIWFARNRPISYLFSIKLPIFWVLWKLDCFRIFHFYTFLKVFVSCHFFIWEESEACITRCINHANILRTLAKVTSSVTLCYLPHILYSCILNTRHLKAYAKECIMKTTSSSTCSSIILDPVLKPWDWWV